MAMPLAIELCTRAKNKAEERRSLLVILDGIWGMMGVKLKECFLYRRRLGGKTKRIFSFHKIVYHFLALWGILGIFFHQTAEE